MPKGEKIKIKENVDYACRNKIIFFFQRERERKRPPRGDTNVDNPT